MRLFRSGHCPLAGLLTLKQEHNPFLKLCRGNPLVGRVPAGLVSAVNCVRIIDNGGVIARSIDLMANLTISEKYALCCGEK